uniref:Uncharacterized protein n=1 Tax=Photinus pyralis TaxID=7054 RepID=A0A1Y1NB66_PHOPY
MMHCCIEFNSSLIHQHKKIPLKTSSNSVHILLLSAALSQVTPCIGALDFSNFNSLVALSVVKEERKTNARWAVLSGHFEVHVYYLQNLERQSVSLLSRLS